MERAVKTGKTFFVYKVHRLVERFDAELAVGFSKDEARTTARLAALSAMTDDPDNTGPNTKVLIAIVMAAVDDRLVYSQFCDARDFITDARPLHVPLFNPVPAALDSKRDDNLIKIRNMVLDWRTTLSDFARLLLHRNNQSVTRAATCGPSDNFQTMIQSGETIEDEDRENADNASYAPVEDLQARLSDLVAGEAMTQAEKDAAKVVSNFSDAAIAVIALAEVSVCRSCASVSLMSSVDREQDGERRSRPQRAKIRSVHKVRA